MPRGEIDGDECRMEASDQVMYRLAWQEQPDQGRGRLRSRDEAHLKGEDECQQSGSPLISSENEALCHQTAENTSTARRCEQLTNVKTFSPLSQFIPPSMMGLMT